MMPYKCWFVLTRGRFESGPASIYAHGYFFPNVAITNNCNKTGYVSKITLICLQDQPLTYICNSELTGISWNVLILKLFAFVCTYMELQGGLFCSSF